MLSTTRVYSHLRTFCEEHPHFLSWKGVTDAPEGFQPDFFSTPLWFDVLEKYGNTFSAHVSWLACFSPDQSSALVCPMGKQPGSPFLYSLSNYYSPNFGPCLFVKKGEALQLPSPQALADWFKAHPALAASLNIHPVHADAPWGLALREALIRAGFRTDTYLRFANWYHITQALPFGSYWENRPSRLRHTVERGWKKARQRGEIFFELIQTPGEALESAIVDFRRLYEQSGKPRESHPQFIDMLCRASVAEGQLRLGLLKLNGQTIAAQIWFVAHGKAAIYKLVHDAEAQGFSAGSLLSASLMAHVMDVDHVQLVDYLSGDETYKADWMSARRECIGLLAFNTRTLRGRLAAWRHFGGRFLKRLIYPKTSP